MADDLLVSGGGSLIVATDALRSVFDAVDDVPGRLRAVRLGVAELLHREGRQRSLELPLAALEALCRLERAEHELTAAEQLAGVIASGLRLSLEAYGGAEDVAGAAMQHLVDRGAWLGGVILRLVGVPLAVGVVANLGLVSLATRTSPADLGHGMADFLEAHPELLNNPALVAFARSAVMAADDGMMGLAGVSWLDAMALGDEGAGIAGVSTVAALLSGAMGVLGFANADGGRVAVERTERVAGASPPVGVRDRAERIPDPGSRPRGEQIRIDRYTTPGKADRFDVYIAGTASGGLGNGPEPFDMASNLRGLAESSPASYIAVIQAMRDAGVTASTPVVLNGYSQGGLIASLVAASGDYTVAGVVTFGAPNGQVELPPEIPVLTVRHSEDIVPAAGGADTNPAALVVERQVFAGRDMPTRWALPAHQLSYYSETAGLIDDARSRQLSAAVAALASFANGATEVESTLWQARRTSDPAAGCEASGDRRSGGAGSR